MALGFCNLNDRTPLLAIFKPMPFNERAVLPPDSMPDNRLLLGDGLRNCLPPFGSLGFWGIRFYSLRSLHSVTALLQVVLNLLDDDLLPWEWHLSGGLIELPQLQPRSR